MTARLRREHDYVFVRVLAVGVVAAICVAFIHYTAFILEIRKHEEHRGMTTAEDLDAYFRSLNTITRRILDEKENVKNAFGEDEWNKLDEDEQEEVFTRYIIDDRIRQKYAGIENEETPPLFPMMKINCGELITADNQNDDLITWRDEHSGPFSWMTRSQQDLTLDELDFPDEKAKREKSHSPDPARQQRLSGLGLLKPTNTKECSLLDEITELSMIFSSRKKEEKQRDEEEMFSSHYKSCSANDDDNQLLVDTPTGSVQDYRKDSVSSHTQRDVAPEKVFTHSNKKWSSRSKEPKSEAELCLIDEKLDSSSHGEQVSPVFIEDFRESFPAQNAEGFLFPDATLHLDSSTGIDVLPSTRSLVQDLLVDDEHMSENVPDNAVICVQPTSASVIDDANIMNCTVSEAKSTKPEITSGFDFLDNW